MYCCVCVFWQTFIVKKKTKKKACKSYRMVWLAFDSKCNYNVAEATVFSQWFNIMSEVNVDVLDYWLLISDFLCLYNAHIIEKKGLLVGLVSIHG